MFTGLLLSSLIWMIASMIYCAVVEQVVSDKNLWWTLPMVFGPFLLVLMYGTFLI